MTHFKTTGLFTVGFEAFLKLLLKKKKKKSAFENQLKTQDLYAFKGLFVWMVGLSQKPSTHWAFGHSGMRKLTC